MNQRTRAVIDNFHQKMAVLQHQRSKQAKTKEKLPPHRIYVEFAYICSPFSSNNSGEIKMLIY